MVFDTETTPTQLSPDLQEHKLVFGWACRTRFHDDTGWSEPEWFRFTTPESFLWWLEEQARPKQRLYVYCHNGNFDWQVIGMHTNLPTYGWKCVKAIFEDPPNYFRWTKGNKTLLFVDTTNYWQQSLKKIGERLGILKLELPPNWHDAELSDTYCRRDCEIVLAAIKSWIYWLQTNDLGSMALSTAGQAWTAYLHRFLDHPIYIDVNDKALELARDCYVGGRVEARVLNRDVHGVTVLDINSMYPAVMRDGLYPTRLHGIYKRVTHKELAKWLLKYAVVAHVQIRTDIPAYPLRTPHGLIFPTGDFRTYLASPELAFALERGHVVNCDAAAIYDRAPLFTRFVDELYAMRLKFREAGDAVGSENSKKIQNSLYGKFGQRSGHEEIIGRTDSTELKVVTELDIVTGKKYRVRHIAGLILSRSQDSESRESHPAIAATVTSYGRILLWRLIETAGLENVFYTDTDSLHTSLEGVRRLEKWIDPAKLGYLKREKHITRAVYHGPKDYELDGVRTLKGIRPTATVLGAGHFRQEQWVSLRGSAMLGHSGGPLVRVVEKRYRRVYRKGVVAASGDVSPFVLGEMDGGGAGHGDGFG